MESKVAWRRRHWRPGGDRRVARTCQSRKGQSKIWSKFKRWPSPAAGGVTGVQGATGEARPASESKRRWKRTEKDQACRVPNHCVEEAGKWQNASFRRSCRQALWAVILSTEAVKSRRPEVSVKQKKNAPCKSSRAVALQNPAKVRCICTAPEQKGHKKEDPVRKNFYLKDTYQGRNADPPRAAGGMRGAVRDALHFRRAAWVSGQRSFNTLVKFGSVTSGICSASLCTKKQEISSNIENCSNLWRHIFHQIGENTASKDMSAI